ncbi:MAG: hypothetical protein FWG88_00025 [Oscillospiraceae bacterium]|nr:hypothetical protein [Oscillospiraceae bacterium]
MRFKKNIVLCLCLLLGIVIGTGAVYSTFVIRSGLYYDSDYNKEQKVKKPDYAINDNGETYGSVVLADLPDDEPDLIAVLGDNGNRGYVWKIELYGESPSSPAEALKIQEQRVRDGDFSRIINVYDKNGRIVLDTFTISFSEEMITYYINATD